MNSSANEGLLSLPPQLPSSDLTTSSLFFSKLFHRYSHLPRRTPFFRFDEGNPNPAAFYPVNNSSSSYYLIKKEYHRCSFSDLSLFAPDLH